MDDQTKGALLPAHATVAEAAAALEARGELTRRRDAHLDLIAAHVAEFFGRELPADLAAFYSEGIERIGDFPAIWPSWNKFVGWRGDAELEAFKAFDAVPIFGDGCGNTYAVDLAADHAVYFFDAHSSRQEPDCAAGSSIARFLLLLADHDRALQEQWLVRWELRLDPDIDKCVRAPAIWNAD